MRTYKIEYFRQLGASPDPATDTKLNEITIDEALAGLDHNITIQLPVGQSKVYSRSTDNSNNISRISNVRTLIVIE